MKKKFFFVSLATFIFVILINYSRYNIQGFMDGQKSTTQTIDKELKVITGEITENMVISQDFISIKPNLSQIKIFFSTFNRVNDCDIKVEILDYNNVLLKQTINCKDLKDNSYYNIRFAPISQSFNKLLTIRITSENGKEGNAVTLWRNPTSNAYNVNFNNIELPGSLVFDAIYTNSFSLSETLLTGTFFSVMNCILLGLLNFIKK